VWRACTDAGLGCCIKFPISETGTDELFGREQLAQIEEEAANWHQAYGEIQLESQRFQVDRL